MNKIKLFILLFTTLSFLQTAAQTELNGTITDIQGNPIQGATVEVKNSNLQGVSTENGNFIIADLPTNTYTITITHIGYKTYVKKIQPQPAVKSATFILEPDYLELESIIVTGNFDPRTPLESSTSVSTLNAKKIQAVFPRGTANVLKNIPGNFVDASAGEVFTKVYSRGISASAEDDLGWYYVSLQEDGLPVSLVQHSYFSPDIFHRVDITTNKLEALRGGSASITAMNAPGGIYNFISYDTTEDFGGEVQVSGGVQGEQNALYRIDARVGGAIGNNWYVNFGGHYRHDEGARNTSFTFGKGGQVKFDLTKKLDQGYLKFYGKILNDKTNRWTGVAATNWDNPSAAFGQDFNTTSLLMPSFDGEIPDTRNSSGGETNRFNPAQGVYAKDVAFGIDFSKELGNNWILRNNIKTSIKDADWQTSISNVLVSIDNPLAYFISGASFPIGQVVFKDAITNEEVSRIDNSGILSGEPANYITNGRLPNDAIMGTSAWYKKNTAEELINQLSLRKKTKKHEVTLGADLGLSYNTVFTQGTFGFVTYEPSPRMLQVTLENPGSPTIALSDSNGLSNYGGLFFINGSSRVRQFATFLNDKWEINDKIYADLGVRLENINHKGSKDRFAPFSATGGLDGNPNTAYDNGILTPTGEQDLFNYHYNYVSYSAGLNYKINKETALFSRFSKGNKAPELNYYYNNFSNVPIRQKGEIQQISQAEIGIKHQGKNVSFTSTLFWSELKNIGFSNFEFDADTNRIFYTPIQYNTSRTLGLEWESAYTPFHHILFRFNGVIQEPKATNWKVYDAAGTVDSSDDTIVDFSNNTLAFNPNLMFTLGTEYQKAKTSAFFRWQFMGKRAGNIANAFTLNAHSIFNAGIGYQITKNLSANVLVTNLFNSEGLTNFFGANSFGANANGVTKEFVLNNPDASFIVVPVLPRSGLVKLSYKF